MLNIAYILALPEASVMKSTKAISAAWMH